MVGDTIRNDEFLVLSDEQGNYYAIPRDTVEQHRLTGEQKQRLEQLLDEEVSGYLMDSPLMLQALAEQRMADRQKEAADARLIRSARLANMETPFEGTQEGVESEAGISTGMMTGVWAKLAFLLPVGH